jgi:hypothetical protein
LNGSVKTESTSGESYSISAGEPITLDALTASTSPLLRAPALSTPGTTSPAGRCRRSRDADVAAGLMLSCAVTAAWMSSQESPAGDSGPGSAWRSRCRCVEEVAPNAEQILPPLIRVITWLNWLFGPTLTVAKVLSP